MMWMRTTGENTRLVHHRKHGGFVRGARYVGVGHLLWNACDLFGLGNGFGNVGGGQIGGVHVRVDETTGGEGGRH